MGAVVPLYSLCWSRHPFERRRRPGRVNELLCGRHSSELAISCARGTEACYRSLPHKEDSYHPSSYVRGKVSRRRSLSLSLSLSFSPSLPLSPLPVKTSARSSQSALDDSIPEARE